MKKTILIFTTIFSMACNLVIAQNINEIEALLNEASKDDKFLKDFTVELKPNQEVRNSFVLSKNSKYGFYFYQKESNQIQFILTDKEENSFDGGIIIEKTGVSKYEYLCPKTGVYHLKLKNLSSKELTSMFLFTFIEMSETEHIEEIVPINKQEENKDHPKLEYSDKDETYFFVVEEMPKFNGKNNDYDEFKEFISGELRYPKEAIDKKIEGRVFVQFVVGKDGYIKEAKVARGIHPSLDQESLRAVYSSPRWEPGKQRGQAVNVVFTFPITFKLP
jgi:TonB family protein